MGTRVTDLPDSVVSQFEAELAKLGESAERTAELRTRLWRCVLSAYKAGMRVNPQPDWSGLATWMLTVSPTTIPYASEVLTLLGRWGLRRIGHPEVVQLCIDAWVPGEGPKPRSVPGAKP